MHKLESIAKSLIKSESRDKGCDLPSDYLCVNGNLVVLKPLLDNRASAIKTARHWRDRIVKQGAMAIFFVVARFKGGQYKAMGNKPKD